MLLALPRLALWFRATPIRILRGGLAVRLDALLYLGVWDGKHAVYEIREGVELGRHLSCHALILA